MWGRGEQPGPLGAGHARGVEQTLSHVCGGPSNLEERGGKRVWQTSVSTACSLHLSGLTSLGSWLTNFLFLNGL